MPIECNDIAESDLKTGSVKEIKVRKDIGKVPVNRLIPLVHFKKVKEGFTTKDFAELTFSSIEQSCVALAYYKEKKSWLDRIRIGSRNRYFVSDSFPIDEAINVIKIGQRMKDPTTLRCIQKLIEFEAKNDGIENG